MVDVLHDSTKYGSTSQHICPSVPEGSAKWMDRLRCRRRRRDGANFSMLARRINK